MTMADKIRQMSNDELRGLLCKISKSECEKCAFADGKECGYNEECAALVWLKGEEK